MVADPLTPVDYVFTGAGSHPITFAFFYQDTLDAALLEDSLNEALDHFPILRSRLVKTSEHDYGFQLADDGLSFETAMCEATVKDSQEIRHFITPVRSVEEEPLTRIKLTQTPQGSVLGVSISHALVDGFSYFHFLSSWARISQGARFLSPSHQRRLLIPEIPDGRKRLSSEDVLARCGLFYGEERGQPETEPAREERLFLSREKIRGWLAEAEDEIDVSLSENDVLVATLWKEYVPRWSAGSDNPTTYITCPVDFRRAVREVPRTYFGCALCFVTASIELESLIQASVGDLAGRVHQAVSRARRDYVWGSLETLESLRRQQGLGAMEKIHVRHPDHGLIVTNISRLPLRDLDFGTGPPTHFLVYTEILRGAAILPAQDGVEIVVMQPSGSA